MKIEEKAFLRLNQSLEQSQFSVSEAHSSLISKEFHRQLRKCEKVRATLRTVQL